MSERGGKAMNGPLYGNDSHCTLQIKQTNTNNHRY